jgi:glycerophosphoryl diester phosphodiesterase
MAFERETWRRIRELRPDIAAGALYSPGTLRSMGSTLAKELEAARTAGVSVIGLHQDLVDASIVAAARQHAMTLGVWTVNDAGALRRFIDLGAPIVITDRPDLAKQLVNR